MNHDTKAIARMDAVRGMMGGILDAAWFSLILAIAIRHFDAPLWMKSLISAAWFSGLTANPFTIAYASRFRPKAVKLGSLYCLATGVFLCLGMIYDSLALYALCVGAAYFIYAQHVPLVTHVYSHVYKNEERGKYVSITFMLTQISGVIFALAGGMLLDYDKTLYPIILGVCALGAFGNAWYLRKLPSPTVEAKASGNVLQNISLLWKDKLFGWMVLSWSLVGGTMVMIFPLRQEYLLEEQYGIYTSHEIQAWMTFIIPSIAYIISVRIWGKIFDKHFIRMRAAINIIFIAAILCFFTTDNLIIIGIGSALIGIGFGGGKLTWNLWVTKIAPPEKVSSYMSIHMAAAGLRGMIVPFIGFPLIVGIGPTYTAIIACCFIFVSALMFWRVRNNARWGSF